MLGKLLNKLYDFYYKHYKKIILFPFLLLIASFGVIGYTWVSTGSPIYTDSSIKGGVSLTFSYNNELNTELLRSELVNSLGTEDLEIIMVRSQLSGQIIGYEIQTEEGISQDSIQSVVEDFIGESLSSDDISFGSQSSVIGRSFLSDAGSLIVVGFILMSIVSYFYFKNVIPALSITFSTFSDFVGIIAVLDLFQIKFSVATIGALLMVIGYSTDSDILLATNILKRKDKPLKERMKSAMGTELTMDLAAVVTFSLMFFLSTTEIIKHIALILLIGIFFDVINTWGQNASLQRLYAKRYRKDEVD